MSQSSGSKPQPRTIKSIKLEDFGIFKNSAHTGQTVPEFRRFDLVYGWNRSGKTTFSRGFTSCEHKVMFPDYTSGKLKITLSDDAEITHSNLSGCDLPIKVFNADFIKANIAFESGDKHMEPIVYIGEQDIESKNKLDAALAKKDGLQKAFEDAEKAKKEKENAEDKFRITTAQAITPVLTNKNVRDRYYSYDKAKVKERIDEIGIDNFAAKKLGDKDFQALKKLIGSEAKSKQTTLNDYSFSFSINGAACSDFTSLTTAINDLLKKQAVSETIDRLKNDADINDWVKTGLGLHENKEEKAKCLFCQNNIQDGFWDSLKKHFSKDYEQLSASVRNAENELKKLNPQKIAKENKDLYPETQLGYTTAAKSINDAIEKIEAWVQSATDKIAAKQKDLFAVVDPMSSSEDLLKAYNDAVVEANKAITEHNKKTDGHNDQVKEAKQKIEDHLLAVALETNNYGQMKKDVEHAATANTAALTAKNANITEINTLQQKTSDTGKAVTKINEYLEQFFGQKEIQLDQTDVDSGKGYVLKRAGGIAKNLSEGEKTAIAFSYFITKTAEKEFKLKESIIFIDDPISSLDSNFIYHCFSLIKNHFNNSGQLFISTHNFEFFGLVKEWFMEKNPKSWEKDKSGNKKPDVSEFFMLDTEEDGNGRISCLKELDGTLKKYKSEYHYLFFLLNEFITTPNSDYKKYYIIGNIARRFFEIFSNFKIPTTGNTKSKLHQMQTMTVSDVEKDKVYKLINEFSHAADPTRALQHNDKTEAKEAVKTLLKIVEENDKTHFDILKKEVLPPTNP